MPHPKPGPTHDHAHNLLALLHDGCFKTPAATGQTIERFSVFENVKNACMLDDFWSMKGSHKCDNECCFL